MSESDLSWLFREWRGEEIANALEAAWNALPSDDGLRHVLFAETDPVSKLWAGSIVDVSTPQDEPTVPIGDDLALPRVLTIRRGTITIVVDNTNGAPSYTVTIDRANSALLRRLRLQPVVEQALAHVTTTTADRSAYTSDAPPAERALLVATYGSEAIAAFEARMRKLVDEYGGPVPAGSTVHSPVEARRYVRSKVSERDVERAAEAYNTGGIEELKRVMLVGDRQAWRYVTRAQDAGLVERKRARRRTKGTS